MKIREKQLPESGVCEQLIITMQEFCSIPLFYDLMLRPGSKEK
jgi:hypothetical protein